MCIRDRRDTRARQSRKLVEQFCSSELEEIVNDLLVKVGNSQGLSVTVVPARQLANERVQRLFVHAIYIDVRTKALSMAPEGEEGGSMVFQ